MLVGAEQSASAFLIKKFDENEGISHIKSEVYYIVITFTLCVGRDGNG
jgi:hypothetical protein